MVKLDIHDSARLSRSGAIASMRKLRKGIANASRQQIVGVFQGRG